MAPGEPIFSAVSSNAHHLYTLLQCIGFASQVTVQITPDGIRFSVEEGRVVQGLAFLDKALFTTYTFNQPAADTTGNENGEPGDNDNDNDDDDDDDDISEITATYPCFIMSLAALLETLKIFGLNDASGPSSNKAVSIQQPNPSASNAFTAPALLLDRSCTLQYFQHGAPLSITLTEAGVKTICELTTYEPDSSSVDIPLQRDAIMMKIIMRSAWLHNAISELDATNPTILKVSASAKRAPFFALCASGGPFSESVVEFSIDNHQQQHNQDPHQPVPYHKVLADDGTSRARTRRAKLAPTVTETFLVSPPSSMGSRIEQNYRFPLIRKAARAMAVANKVSIRGDRQGVLSLQFMVELDDAGMGGKQQSSTSTRDNTGTNTGMGTGTGTGSAGNVAFVDFRFVPLVNEDEGDGEGEDGDAAPDEDDEL